MKYLSEIVQDEQTAVLTKHGAFFAFGNEQFEEAKDPNIPFSGYYYLYSGMYAPKTNADALVADLADIHTRGIATDIELHGLTAIIQRELSNHEAYYTGEIEETVDALTSYPGADYDTVMAVYKNKKYEVPLQHNAETNRV